MPSTPRADLRCQTNTFPKVLVCSFNSVIEQLSLDSLIRCMDLKAINNKDEYHKGK